jgi:polysaccharide biosynthesis/export protein
MRFCSPPALRKLRGTSRGGGRPPHQVEVGLPILLNTTRRQGMHGARNIMHAPVGSIDLTMRTSLARALLPIAACTLIAACNSLPASGPSGREVEDAGAKTAAQAVQVIEVDDRIARRLVSQKRQQLFSETLAQGLTPESTVGAGDALEVHIWEAPPATLFGSGIDPRVGLSTAQATALPEQMVGSQGDISVPFAGRIKALGRPLRDIEADIVKRLQGKANHPEVMVRMTRSTSSMVTVVGDVATSVRMPLTASGERLLDALAAAGGVRQPVNKMMLQVTRTNEFHAMPLDQVIRDPRQNITLRAGDVITALFQPHSFTALGATGRNDEINFEAQGITLSQALARVGGLLDNRSNPEGVFIFRFESRDALDWPRQPVATTPDGLVPVVYRVDLRKPSSFFVMQNFAINPKDVLYVSNAPTTELQKFLNLVFSITYPIVNLNNAFNP